MTTDKKFIQLSGSEVNNLKQILCEYAESQRGLATFVAQGLIDTIVQQENVDWSYVFSKELASRGGSVRSEAKAAAARESGKLGGRPRKITEIIKRDEYYPELNDFTVAIRGWLTHVSNMRKRANETVLTGQTISPTFKQLRIEAYRCREMAIAELARLKTLDHKIPLNPELNRLLLDLREKIDSFIPLLDNRDLDEEIAIYCREIITNDKELQRLSEILEYFGFPGYPRFKLS